MDELARAEIGNSAYKTQILFLKLLYQSGDSKDHSKTQISINHWSTTCEEKHSSFCIHKNKSIGRVINTYYNHIKHKKNYSLQSHYLNA